MTASTNPGGCSRVPLWHFHRAASLGCPARGRAHRNGRKLLRCIDPVERELPGMQLIQSLLVFIFAEAGPVHAATMP